MRSKKLHRLYLQYLYQSSIYFDNFWQTCTYFNKFFITCKFRIFMKSKTRKLIDL